MQEIKTKQIRCQEVWARYGFIRLEIPYEFIISKTPQIL